MKLKGVLTLLALLVLQVSWAQNFGATENANAGKASVKWEKTEHDLGEIPQGVPVTVKFKLKNEGMVPVILTNVESTCGCTVPAYPKEPIKYGQTVEIAATFDAKSPGAFYKTIKVHTNAGGKPEELRLRGTVIK